MTATVNRPDAVDNAPTSIPAAVHGDRPTGVRRDRAPASVARAYVIWLMLIASLLSWRTGVFYSGGLDPTVVAKAVLGLVAVVLAVDAALRSGRRIWLGARTMTIVTIYLAVTVIGALADGSATASVILAVRVFLVAATVASVCYAWPRAQVVSSAMMSLALVGAVLGLSGAGSLVHGRLSGGLLPVQANQLAVLFGPPAIWLFWRLITGQGARPRQAVVLIALLGLSYMTGSRTGLVALVVAFVVVVLLVRRLPVGGFVAGAIALPVVIWVVLGTAEVNTYVNRDGTGKVATLGSRTTAWKAAFAMAGGFWHRYFGGGLAVKTVPVSGTYWSAQVLDSSWVSAFVQGGILGVAVLALFAVSALVAAFRSGPDIRALLVALVGYALIRSALENGLVDAYVLCVVMLVPTFLTELRSDPATGQGRPRSLPGVRRRRPTTPASRALSSAPSPNRAINTA